MENQQDPSRVKDLKESEVEAVTGGKITNMGSYTIDTNQHNAAAEHEFRPGNNLAVKKMGPIYWEQPIQWLDRGPLHFLWSTMLLVTRG